MIDFQNATRTERQTWLENIISAIPAGVIAQVDRLIDEEKALGDVRSAQQAAYLFARVAGVGRPSGMREYREALAQIDARMGETLTGIPSEAQIALCWWRRHHRKVATYAAACKRFA